MNDLAHIGWSFVAWTLLLASILAWVAPAGWMRNRSVTSLAAIVSAAAILCLIPISGLPLFRWGAGFVEHWSIPLVVAATAHLVRRTAGVKWFHREDWLAGAWFGTVSGLALYPMALGLGSFDPYALGWKFGALFVAMAGITAVLLWRGNRFGLSLVLAAAGWHLGVTLSGNLWDCLVDPVYSLVCTVSLAAMLIRGRPTPTEALSASSQAHVH